MKVLIVDDRDANLDLLRHEFQAEGFATIEAHDGVEAIELLAKARPDAIVADVLMPNMDGYRLCRAVRADPIHAKVPFIIYSNTDFSPMDQELFLRCGADKYLKKPAAPAAIIEAVRVTAAAKREENPASEAKAHDSDILRQYSQSLIYKLEEKNIELQEQNEKLARAEHELRQSQKLESVGLLAGGIAHDFNNILCAIMGHAEFLEQDLRSGTAKLADAVEIVKASQRAAALTRQLLAFSRRQVLEPKILDLNALVDNLDPMLSRVIGENIKLAGVKGPKLGSVKADPSQLEQVILNLVINARDAMPDGGLLTIETANAVGENCGHVGEGPEQGRCVMLSVADTGTGMSPETQARLFEPFFTTKEPGKGTGLGLSTVYGIVKQSGGHIKVESAPGKGSTFKVYLPLVEQAADKLTGNLPPAAKTGSETILLVEDEPAVRAIARRTLVKFGYGILEAKTGQEAELIVRERGEDIALMVTDLVMPGIDGAELARRVRELCPRMKIVFMSGFIRNAAQREALFEPGADFIHKPFTPRALAQKVRAVLDKPMKRELVAPREASPSRCQTKSSS